MDYNRTQFLLKLPRQKVESSTIASAAFDFDSSTLVLEFKSGGIYSYSPFTQDAFITFMNADSKGSYFHQNIKNNNNIAYACLEQKPKN
jgi:hypothetical protein